MYLRFSGRSIGIGGPRALGRRKSDRRRCIGAVLGPVPPGVRSASDRYKVVRSPAIRRLSGTQPAIFSGRPDRWPFEIIRHPVPINQGVTTGKVDRALESRIYLAFTTAKVSPEAQAVSGSVQHEFLPIGGEQNPITSSGQSRFETNPERRRTRPEPAPRRVVLGIRTPPRNFQPGKYELPQVSMHVHRDTVWGEDSGSMRGSDVRSAATEDAPGLAQ